MKKLIFMVFAILCISQAKAQVPGYQGLKFSAKYDFGIMHPIIVGKRGKLPMLYHNVSLDYVVSRKWMLGVKGGYMTCPLPFKDFIYNSSFTNNGKYEGKYTQYTVSVIGKKFMTNAGYIAPVGNYVTVGLYYQYIVHHAVIGTEEYDNGNYQVAVRGHKTIGHMGGLTVGMGRNFILADRLIIDVGFNLNISPMMIFRVSDWISSSEIPEDIAFQDAVSRNLFHVYAGLGVLLF